MRIPIERAMELVAQRGLPVAPAAPQEPIDGGRFAAEDYDALDEWICQNLV